MLSSLYLTGQRVSGTVLLSKGSSNACVGRRRSIPKVTAKLETPSRPSESSSGKSEETDAFKELVALSKKQSVNRPQDVGSLTRLKRIRPGKLNLLARSGAQREPTTVRLEHPEIIFHCQVIGR